MLTIYLTHRKVPYRTRPNTAAQRQDNLSGTGSGILSELAGTDGGIDPFPAAVRATRMPMVITDPHQPDNPIVFVNDSFCRLSGYSRDEIIGNNCRFLQGPETDPASIKKMREALATPCPIEIDLRNHRKDGAPF